MEYTTVNAVLCYINQPSSCQSRPAAHFTTTYKISYKSKLQSVTRSLVIYKTKIRICNLKTKQLMGLLHFIIHTSFHAIIFVVS